MVDDDEITVSRPYLGLDVSRSGGRIVAGELTNQEGLWSFTVGAGPGGAGGWAHLSGGRARAVSDVRPVAALDQAGTRGWARLAGRRTVAGRRCRLVVTGQPLGQPLAAATPSSRVTLCIDATGIPLAESWVLDGKPAITMTAQRLELDPNLAPSTFTAAPALPGPVQTLAVPLRPAQAAGLVPAPRAPTGYRYDAAFIDLQEQPGSGMPATTTTIFFSGPDRSLFELEYQPGQVAARGIGVRLGGGRTGYLALGYDVSSLSVDSGPAASVVLLGTDPTVLAEAGRNLFTPTAR